MKRGVVICPQCKSEVIDQHGVHAYIMRHVDNAIGAVIGCVLSAFIPCLIYSILSDPNIGYLDLSKPTMTAMWIVIPIVGAVLGWHGPAITRYLREQQARQ